MGRLSSCAGDLLKLPDALDLVTTNYRRDDQK